MDVQHWRTYRVYEKAVDLKRRIAMTALSLEAIGASGAAKAVREAKRKVPGAIQDTRTADYESHETITNHFKSFVELQEGELLEDISRYGDPRPAILESAEREHLLAYERQQQLEDSWRMRDLMAEIDSLDNEVARDEAEG